METIFKSRVTENALLKVSDRGDSFEQTTNETAEVKEKSIVISSGVISDSTETVVDCSNICETNCENSAPIQHCIIASKSNANSAKDDKICDFVQMDSHNFTSPKLDNLVCNLVELSKTREMSHDSIVGTTETRDSISTSGLSLIAAYNDDSNDEDDDEDNDKSFYHVDDNDCGTDACFTDSYLDKTMAVLIRTRLKVGGIYINWGTCVQC